MRATRAAQVVAGLIFAVVSTVAMATEGNSLWCIGEGTVSAPGSACAAHPPSVASISKGVYLLRHDDVLELGTLVEGEPGADDSELGEVALTGLRSSSREIVEVSLSVSPADRSSFVWDYRFSVDELRRLPRVRLAPGTYRWRFSAEGHDEFETTVAVAEERTRLALVVLQAHPRFTGSVIDAVSGQPMTGAAIVGPASELLATVTAGDGSFECSIRPDAWPRSIGVTYPARGTKWLSVPARVADVDLGVIRLEESGSVAVELPVNRSVATVRLHPWSEQEPGAQGRLSSEVGSDDREVTFAEVPPGKYRVVVEGREPLERLSLPVDVEAGRQSSIDASLSPIRLSIRARLNDDPVAAGSLQVEHGEAGWRTQLTLDDEGGFDGELWQGGPLAAFLVVPGKSTPYFATKMLRGVTEARWELNAGGHSVRGKVRNARGEPIAGARVSMQSDGPDGSSTKLIHAGATGEFAIDYVRPGMHRVVVSSEGYLSATEHFQTIPGDSERQLTIVLSRGRDVTIVATTAGGGPASGAAVIASGTSGFTGADGRVTLTLPVGQRERVFVVPREGSFASATIEGSDEPATVEIRVPAPEVSIVVRTESVEGSAIQGVGLLVRHNGVMLPREVIRLMGELQGIRFESGPDGSARLGGLPIGLFEFWPIFDYTKIERMQQFPGQSAASIAAQPGANWVLMTFERQSVGAP